MFEESLVFGVAIFTISCFILCMKLQNEINLNLVSDEGETFEFDSETIKSIEAFKDVSTHDAGNSIAVSIMPIGSKHFEVKAEISLKRPLSCSRCGEGFEDWFKESTTEYLSLDKNEEGEDKGFLLLESPKWSWPTFVIESVELETPYQIYKNGEACLKSCVHYDEAVKNGWISTAEKKPILMR